MEKGLLPEQFQGKSLPQIDFVINLKYVEENDNQSKF